MNPWLMRGPYRLSPLVSLSGTVAAHEVIGILP